MADDFLGRKMEEYRSRPATRRPAMTLERLLVKNRSYRGYDASYTVRAEQLHRILEVVNRIPTACNQQVLRYRPVLADEAQKVLGEIRMGAALPELHLPLPGTEPNAFIIVCSTVKESPLVDVDLGIAVQSMLLRAVEIGLNGLCIGAFHRGRIREAFDLPYEPLMILAIGRGIERIELTPIGADESRAYYRRDGVHYVPKVRLEELILGPAATAGVAPQPKKEAEK